MVLSVEGSNDITVYAYSIRGFSPSPEPSYLGSVGDFLAELRLAAVALMTFERHVPPDGSRPLPSTVVGDLLPA